MAKTDNDSRRALDTAATSIRNLVLDLERQEKEGRPVTATEIRKIAGQLKAHVDDLLAASKSLGNVKKSEE